MKVLVVKTSSLGDVIHALPALTDATRALPGIRFDWVVEETFAEIPAWHASVDGVIPVALRRWRRRPLLAITSGEWGAFKGRLTKTHYDCVIDAQGLVKSALITRIARGLRCGLDRASAREPLASLAYQQRQPVAKGQHAVTRVRKLFAGVLGYAYRETTPDYGVTPEHFNSGFSRELNSPPHVMFLYGTSWPSKEWPEENWIALGRLVNDAGLGVCLSWHNPAEKARATRIGSALTSARILPRMDLQGVAAVLATAGGVVGVDTGLSQLAAALGTPSVTLYGATQPALTGAWGRRQQNLSAVFPCAPCLRRTCIYQGPAMVKPACYTSLPPERVWQALRLLMAERFNQSRDSDITALA